MTCIVGLEENGTVFIGADSASIAPETLEICRRADEKVFLTDDGNFILGFAGSFRIGQLLRYALVPPPQKVDQDDMAYLVTDFIDAVRTMQKDKGSLKKENEVEEHEAMFLLGFNGKLYVVEGDFQVGRPVDNFMSVGSGANIALGAMHATKDLGIPAEKRIILALEAATEFSAGVRAPFHVLKLECSY